jgi:hypothetical protein
MPPARPLLRVAAVPLAVLAALFVVAAPGRAADPVAARAATPPDDAALAPSTAPPWNPDRPLPRRRAWERAVLLPGRVATLPLSALGALTSTTLQRAEDAELVKTTPSARVTTRAGFRPGFASLGDRSGVGPSLDYVTPVGEARLRARAEATTNAYAAGRLALEWAPMTLAAATAWRPRERFYGLGMAGDDSRPSDYALARDLVELRFAAHRDSAAMHHAPSWSAWTGARRSRYLRGRDTAVPSFASAYPAIAAPWAGRAFADAYAGIGADLDRRAGALRWTRGWRLAGSLERHVAAASAVTPSGSTGGPAYTRLDAIVEAGTSIRRDPRTLRLLLVATELRPDDAGAPPAPDDLARLGGSYGLAGFAAGRFHDLARAFGRVSWVFPLSRRFEMDAHSEWGEVAPALAAARVASLRNSLGVTLHARTNTATYGSLGIDRGAEGFRVSASLGRVR